MGKKGRGKAKTLWAISALREAEIKNRSEKREEEGKKGKRGWDRYSRLPRARHIDKQTGIGEGAEIIQTEKHGRSGQEKRGQKKRKDQSPNSHTPLHISYIGTGRVGGEEGERTKG